jgi:tetratricopeptide (TPR) repeat protein
MADCTFFVVVRTDSPMNLRSFPLAMIVLSLAMSCSGQTTAPDYFQSALKKEKQGDHDGAIADYTKSIELDPLHASTYNNRGNIRKLKGDIEGALADYERAIQLDPNYAYPWGGRAHIKYDRGDIDGAIADLSEALKREPNYMAYYNRAAYHFKKQEWDAVIADCDKSLERSPKFPNPIVSRAAAYYIKRDWKEALPGFRKYAEVNRGGEYNEIWIWLARTHLNETSEANRELAEYLKDKTPPETEQWKAKAIMYLLDKATLEEVLAAAAAAGGDTADEHTCDTWYLAGVKRLQAGDRAGAIDALQRCLATGTKRCFTFEFADSELKALVSQPTLTAQTASLKAPASQPAMPLQNASSGLRLLKEQYQNAIDRALVPVKDGYGRELLKLRDAFTRAGDLDSAVAVDAEIKGQGKTQKPPRLVAAKETYDAAVQRVVSGIKPAYLRELDKLKAELVRAGKLTEAIAVDSEIRAQDTGAVGAAASTPAAPAGGLIIEALIDGPSELRVQKEGIYWINEANAKPGRHNGAKEPTYVNEVAWQPVWDDPADRGTDKSKPYPLAQRLDPGRLELKLLSVSSKRGDAGIEQRDPIKAKGVGSDFSVTIPDTLSGARWYKFALVPKGSR